LLKIYSLLRLFRTLIITQILSNANLSSAAAKILKIHLSLHHTGWEIQRERRKQHLRKRFEESLLLVIEEATVLRAVHCRINRADRALYLELTEKAMKRKFKEIHTNGQYNLTRK